MLPKQAIQTTKKTDSRTTNYKVFIELKGSPEEAKVLVIRDVNELDSVSVMTDDTKTVPRRLAH